MKKIIIPFIIMFIIAFFGKTYAHEHHHNIDLNKMTVADKRADSIMQHEMEEHQQMEAINSFPNYHPLVVHFPIVLLLLAVVFQLLSFFFYKNEFSLVTLMLLIVGVITAWLASNTFHPDSGELAGKAKEILETHERMASFTWWISLIALLIKIPSHFFLKRIWWMEIAVTLLLITSAVTVSIAGHHGAKLVYMQGIGPLGKYMESYRLPVKKIDNTLQDNNTIKQDNDKAESTSGEQEEDHHVGEPGKGPHGGTIEEADPFHMEIVANVKDLVFYLLDGDAKPLDMKNVKGVVKIQYANKSNKTIELMAMDNKLTAMQAINGQVFTAICTLTKESNSYTSTFISTKDLPVKK
jgi:uncharacterized membrane protein